ncbi:MAG: carboxypeptidase-like regulatory domain-containing protein [bacterium]|nr:carboxypeptidase-like regulatory domain-containing protein [bacterium]
MKTTWRYSETVPLLRNISIILFVLTFSVALLIGFAGCKASSRDSGSTVTGRALSTPGGIAVPFIRVQLDGDTAHRLLITDSNGSYTMPKVPTGNYTVTFARFGLKLFSTPVEVFANNDTYIVNFPDLQTGSTDLPGNVRDFQGPIDNADIWIIYDSGGLAHAVSDTEGNFTLPTLPDGNVKVLALAEDHEMELMEGQRVGFEGIYRLDVVMNPTTFVDGGTVHGLIHNSDGVSLDDAYIGLFPNDSLPSVYMIATGEALTANGGLFEMKDVPPGTYQAIVIMSGYQLSSTLVIVEGQNTYDLDINLTEEIY